MAFGTDILPLDRPCAAGPSAAARCLEQAVWQLRVDRRPLIGPGSAARTSYLPLKRQEHQGLPNHCADAVLYGWRATYSFLSKAPVPKPQPGAECYDEYINKLLFEKTQADMRRIRSRGTGDDDMGMDPGAARFLGIDDIDDWGMDGSADGF